MTPCHAVNETAGPPLLAYGSDKHTIKVGRGSGGFSIDSLPYQHPKRLDSHGFHQQEKYYQIPLPRPKIRLKQIPGQGVLCHLIPVLASTVALNNGLQKGPAVSFFVGGAVAEMSQNTQEGVNSVDALRWVCRRGASFSLLTFSPFYPVGEMSLIGAAHRPAEKEAQHPGVFEMPRHEVVLHPEKLPIEQAQVQK